MSEVATVPLALQDFLPVLLGAAGCWLLAEDAGRDDDLVRRVGRVAALLVGAGGLAKAGWKLVLALSGTDLAGVDEALFALLAPGFSLVVWVLLRGRGSAVRLEVPLAVAGVAGATALALRSTAPLLVLTIVAATATGVLAVLRARARGDFVAAVLFALQVVMAFALVPFAGAGQSVSHQWTEQLLNTVGQGAFALAAFRLVTPLVRSTA